MSLYDRLAGLELEIQGAKSTRHARETSSGFERHTSTIRLSGPEHVGLGEDVTYETAHHEALEAAGLPDLAGRYTLDTFSSVLSETDLFLGSEPSNAANEHYRQWALESAALDLALRQAGRSLPDALNRQYQPIRFVVSTRLPDGDPERVHQLLRTYPATEFKLDPTPAWKDETIDALAETDAVRILDLKGQYEDIEVEQSADLALYERLLSAFPDAIIEDPDVGGAVSGLIAAETGRLSWDAPITGIDALHDLPYTPGWLNIKPSRFGTLESLLETIMYCQANGITCYGGGQFELDVGRSHAQAFASLFYPNGPNDLAPRVYNDPEVPRGAPESPLPAFAAAPGLPRGPSSDSR